MVERSQTLESLTAEERLALIGRLRDSLDPAVAAPLSPALAADLDRRETEAGADPDAGNLGLPSATSCGPGFVSALRIRAQARAERAEAFDWYLARSPVASVIAAPPLGSGAGP